MFWLALWTWIVLLWIVVPGLVHRPRKPPVQHVDYERIAQLERELGIGQSEPEPPRPPGPGAPTPGFNPDGFGWRTNGVR
jgi:hypothetical protein